MGKGELKWLRIDRDKHEVNSMDQLIKFVYGEPLRADGNDFGLIIGATNKAVTEVNDRALEMLDGEEVVFHSKDILGPKKDDKDVPSEEDLFNFPPKTLRVCWKVLIFSFTEI